MSLSGLQNFFCDFFTRRILYLLFFIPFCVVAQSPSQRQVPRLKGYLESPYGYWEYLPQQYSSANKLPLVIYLHGIRESGSGTTESDLQKIILGGPPSMVAKLQYDFPFILIAPQSPGLQDGFASATLDEFIDIILKNYKADPDRVYVTGISYGAYATWNIAGYAPQKIAAIVPISSCGNIKHPSSLKNIPVWAFVNSGDYAVPGCMFTVTEKIRKAGGNPLLKIYDEQGHNAWNATYLDEKMWHWLLAQHRSSESINQPPVFVPIEDQTVTIGYPTSIDIQATDRDNDILNFNIEGDLPQGVSFSLNENGKATLTVRSHRSGSFPIAIAVTDAHGNTSHEHFILKTERSPLTAGILLLLFMQSVLIFFPLLWKGMLQVIETCRKAFGGNGILSKPS
jgi:pimeloyl-ACP methyl ester carboxylesterase